MGHIADLNPASIGVGTDCKDGGEKVSEVMLALTTDFAEIDGAVTATDTELNYLDLTTLGTAAASEAIVPDGSANVNASAITWTNLGTVTTVDINGGSLDGVTIGAASAAAGTFTTLTASGAVTFTSGTVDGMAIGGSTPAAGAFTTLTASGAVTFTSGTVNGIAIGGSTPAAGAFTTLTASGAITFTSGTVNGVTIGGVTPAAGTFTTLVGTTAKATSQLGFDTGAGGTVTQVTSRTTGVTINKAVGAITLVSAAGSASWATFTVTNSTVAATDAVIVNQKSGTDLYQIHVTAIGAGSFNITFATTGGTTSESPIFTFAVIKGVTS